MYTDEHCGIFHSQAQIRLMYHVRTHQLRHSQRYHMIVKYRQVDNRQVDWF